MNDWYSATEVEPGFFLSGVEEGGDRGRNYALKLDLVVCASAHAQQVENGVAAAFQEYDYATQRYTTIDTFESFAERLVSNIARRRGAAAEEQTPQSLLIHNIAAQDTPVYDFSPHFSTTAWLLAIALENISCLSDAQNAQIGRHVRSGGGRVLVHCMAGISRSATLVCAYLMHRDDCPVATALATVKAKRQIAKPNVGFQAQLDKWRSHRCPREMPQESPKWGAASDYTSVSEIERGLLLCGHEEGADRQKNISQGVDLVICACADPRQVKSGEVGLFQMYNAGRAEYENIDTVEEFALRLQQHLDARVSDERREKNNGEVVFIHNIPAHDIPVYDISAHFPLASWLIQLTIEGGSLEEAKRRPAGRGAPASRRGIALVHCMAGVSRSTSLLCAYLMQRDDHAFPDVLQRVRTRRGIANPNQGFVAQLGRWHVCGFPSATSFTSSGANHSKHIVDPEETLRQRAIASTIVHRVRVACKESKLELFQRLSHIVSPLLVSSHLGNDRAYFFTLFDALCSSAETGEPPLFASPEDVFDLMEQQLHPLDPEDVPLLWHNYFCLIRSAVENSNVFGAKRVYDDLKERLVDEGDDASWTRAVLAAKPLTGILRKATRCTCPLSLLFPKFDVEDDLPLAHAGRFANAVSKQLSFVSGMQLSVGAKDLLFLDGSVLPTVIETFVPFLARRTSSSLCASFLAPEVKQPILENARRIEKALFGEDQDDETDRHPLFEEPTAEAESLDSLEIDVERGDLVFRSIVEGFDALLDTYERLIRGLPLYDGGSTDESVYKANDYLQVRLLRNILQSLLGATQTEQCCAPADQTASLSPISSVIGEMLFGIFKGLARCLGVVMHSYRLALCARGFRDPLLEMRCTNVATAVRLVCCDCLSHLESAAALPKKVGDLLRESLVEDKCGCTSSNILEGSALA